MSFVFLDFQFGSGPPLPVSPISPQPESDKTRQYKGNRTGLWDNAYAPREHAKDFIVPQKSAIRPPARHGRRETRHD
jgi:hypothetical protein